MSLLFYVFRVSCCYASLQAVIRFYICLPLCSVMCARYNSAIYGLSTHPGACRGDDCPKGAKGIYNPIHGLIAVRRTSYCKVSRSIEAARFEIRL